MGCEVSFRDVNQLINNVKGTTFFRCIVFSYSILYCGTPIVIDGLFSDWNDVSSHIDPEGDCFNSDFKDIKITNDSEFLFVYIDFYHGEFLMQDWNDFHLYIDADNDHLTGHQANGIGAELVWNFGNRSGFFVIDDQQIPIMQNDIKLRVAPTITSREFEIAIGLDSPGLTLDGDQQFSNGKIVLSEVNGGGDYIPDDEGGLNFLVSDDDQTLFEPISIERYDENNIRVLSYNTLNNGIIDIDRQESFKRIIKALDPDVIALQEHSEWDQVGGIIESWFPNQQWHKSWTYRDLVILSRFQIIQDASMISSERTMVAELDTEEHLGSNLLIFNSHLSCCSNNDLRQDQVDEFSGSWRDWMLNGDGPFQLEVGAPFIHVGDFNFVGYREQVETLRDGNIVDESQFGNDFSPDWDFTDIAETFPQHTHKRMGYTWRNDESSFNPGKLDYIFYSDATITTGNQFILNSLALDELTLEHYGIEQNDTKNASDHLPLIIDIASTNNLGTKGFETIPQSFAKYSNYPNPFNSKTNITYELSMQSTVEIIIVDLSGSIVRNLVKSSQSIGTHTVYWDGLNDKGKEMSSGSYFKILTVNNEKFVDKMLFLK